MRNSGGARKQHLAAVQPGGGAPPSLADRVAAAQAAVTAPRERVSGLEQQLAAAVEAADFAVAAEVREQPAPARADLAMAEAEVRVFAEAEAAVEQERQATERAVQEARQREQAQRTLDRARQVERELRDAAREASTLSRSHLFAAKAANAEAQRIERGVLQAQQEQIAARRLLGEWPEHHPGPTVVGSNEVRALADRDPLIRELRRWRP